MASAVQCPQCGSDNVELDPVQVRDSLLFIYSVMQSY